MGEMGGLMARDGDIGGRGGCDIYWCVEACCTSGHVTMGGKQERIAMAFCSLSIAEGLLCQVVCPD